MISVIIPAYNEEKRIKPTIKKLKKELSSRDEIIVVSDGQDATNRIAKKLKVKVLEFKKRLGKGEALRQGFKASKGDKIVFCDADYSYQNTSIKELTKELKDFDAVIGVRKKRDKVSRRILSTGLKFLQKIFLGFTFTDTQCGFKAFKRKTLKKHLSELKTGDYGFDMELLSKIPREKIKEIVVDWKYAPHSKVNSLSTSLEIFRDLMYLSFQKYTAFWIFVLGLFVVALASSFKKMVLWDGAVYLMNAHWFAGQQIYFELLRPPFWPLFVSMFYRLQVSEIIVKSLPILISPLAGSLTYLFVKKLFSKKAGVIAALLVLTNPLFVFWSPTMYTAIPAICLTLVSLLCLSEKRDCLAIAFATLAFLTRYPFGLLLVAEGVYILINRKISFKKIVAYALIFSAIVAPWLAYNHFYFGSAFQTFKEAQMWLSPNYGPAFYFYNIFSYLSLAAVPFVVGLKSIRLNEKRWQMFLFPLLLFIYLAFFQQHKEIRYILPVVPFFLMVGAIELSRWKYWKIALTIILVVSGFFAYGDVITGYTYCDGIISSTQNLSGNVVSDYWPQTAYYGEVTAFSPQPDMTHLIEKQEISFIVASDSFPYPEELNALKNDETIVLERQISDQCQNYSVFRVIQPYTN